MRSLALVAAIVLVPGTAFAGAISTISGNADTAGSVVHIGPPAPVVTKPAEPKLAPGEELVQLKRIDGKTKVYRTEAWLGGSPVTYVTTASDADLAALARRGIDVASNEPQSIQQSLPAMRGAVAVASADIDREKTGALTPAKPLDAADFKLRLTLAGAN
jgi:hypothetical protein